MDDGLWALVEPLLPRWPQKAPGPRPVDDRLCLQGILYVHYNDVSWQLLPLELGFGSGQTCWRRLGRWHEAGVFEKLHHILLAELHAADELDWTRACVEVTHIRAKKKGGRGHPARSRSTAGRRAVNTTVPAAVRCGVLHVVERLVQCPSSSPNSVRNNGYWLVTCLSESSRPEAGDLGWLDWLSRDTAVGTWPRGLEPHATASFGLLRFRPCGGRSRSTAAKELTRANHHRIHR
ncbi:transposase [Streptomyces sp. NPDC001709]